MTDVQEIIDFLSDLQEDATVPRNVKLRMQNIINILSEDIDLSIRVNKAMQEIDEIGNDVNLESYTRTQIFNIASMLESL